MPDKLSREELVTRNQQLVDAFHQTPLAHRVRRYIIRAVANIPFIQQTLNTERVLFIRPDHLGDMLLATPAIRLLKAARPRSEVHVLAGPWSARILENLPEVDQVLTINFPGFNRSEKKRSPWQPYTYLLRISRQLRTIGYQTAIIMRPDHWWGAMLAHVAGIPARIGYDLTDVRPFLTKAIAHQHEHVVRQNVRLIESWTGPIADDGVPYYLNLVEKAQHFIHEYLQTRTLSANQQLICIHPGSGTWAKRWSEAHWATVAAMLVSHYEGSAIVFTGTDHEHAMIESIIAHMQQPAYNTAGDLTIDQLAALYARARVVIGPDSGPMHIAAAVDVPTVTLFGPADPLEFRPWGSPQQHVVLTSNIGCRPCRVLDWGDDDPDYHPCMRDIQPWQVVQTVQRLLST